MKRFIEGEDRSQTTLLPPSLDDYVAEDNPVRVVEAFVEQLELRQLGYNAQAREFILPYEAVRSAPGPDNTLLEFLQSTYEAAATGGKCDRDALVRT